VLCSDWVFSMDSRPAVTKVVVSFRCLANYNLVQP
jgi:hypothetical protein